MTFPPKTCLIDLFCYLVVLSLTAVPVSALNDDGKRETLSVTVKEVIASYAYITPGADQGIKVGQEVLIGDNTFRILQVSSKTALIQLEGHDIKEGETGSVRIEPAQPTEAKPKVVPRELSFFRGKWPAPVFPAEKPAVKEIPLGPSDTDRQLALTLMAQGSGLFDLTSNAPALGSSQLRTLVRYQPVSQWPLTLNADAAAQLWFAENLPQRPSDASRPLLRIRELQGALGDQEDLYASLGRLRYASRTLGMMDGVRAQAPIVGDLTIGAFGGLLPDPVNGQPTVDTSRFGTELLWDAVQHSWHPLVGLSAYGSIFDGEVDERRIHGSLGLLPEFGRFATQLELALFDEDNPWHASSMEINSASADASLYLGEISLGGRAQMQRPERSLWLASYLPLEWMCITERTAAAAVEESCLGDDISYLFTLDAGLTLDNVAFDWSALYSAHSHADSSQLGTLLHTRLLHLIGRSRLDISLMASTGSLFQTGAVTIGMGTPLFVDRLDISLRYRPALSTYRADTEWFLEHTIGAAILIFFLEELELSLDADLVTGRDVDLVLIQSVLMWRL